MKVRLTRALDLQGWDDAGLTVRAILEVRDRMRCNELQQDRAFHFYRSSKPCSNVTSWKARQFPG
jgi:hypothetical protein